MFQGREWMLTEPKVGSRTWATNTSRSLIESVALVAKFMTLAHKIDREISVIEEKLSRHRDEMSLLLEWLRKCLMQLRKCVPDAELDEVLARLDEILKSIRRTGMPPSMEPIREIHVRHLPDQSARVKLGGNGEAWIKLSRQLARLFMKLIQTGPDTPDRCVPFKARAELAEALGTTERNITQLVSKLRQKLEDHQIERDLIEQSEATYRVAVSRELKIVHH
jgi:hypothetical protein